jgi:prepilin-type N-terminal cleavage/methylation domain-containing protein
MRNLNLSLLRRAVSLTEVLCVLAILSILMAYYGWAMMGAFIKVMAFLKGLQ